MTPSGTDAQFIPIMVSKCLNAGKDKFLNILTGKGEIGSNSELAASGKFFSHDEPIPGYNSSMGMGASKGTPIGGVNKGLSMLAL